MSTRLAELQPLVDEHTRLNAALQALGDVDGGVPVDAAPARAARTGSGAPQTAPGPSRKRAPRGANRLAVLRAAEGRPGATSAELATISGVQANTVHALLARLVKSGELQKETLPTGRTGASATSSMPSEMSMPMISPTFCMRTESARAASQCS